MYKDKYVDLVIARAKERHEKFANWRKYVEEIKNFIQKELNDDAEVMIFGSLVRDEYIVGLSDIDVLIVSSRLGDLHARHELIAKLLTRFGDPFEFHLATPREKKLYIKLAKGDYVEI